MQRVVIVGPGAAGKSTLAVSLGEVTGLPVVELDSLFWRTGLAATPPDRWAAIQRELVGQGVPWIMDGDLGPYDWLCQPDLGSGPIWVIVSLLAGRWRHDH